MFAEKGVGSLFDNLGWLAILILVKQVSNRRQIKKRLPTPLASNGRKKISFGKVKIYSIVFVRC